ncbi:NADH dehydrogenase [ubiquinone] 1 beta subcomplex subunit 2, mitochondrial [Rana temporaria]|uniref:NADH dehydrogenase [ubiquinone] 1 beta subcomplex subunit 2, mitochondrial n=1 Tax=Rana temporaria TaxID=8407 RepID=UPI001AAC525B|nr:NADH dehydrogenase [ubiquinone] 1 beta subcomplex subunit 2, mitochondrial [Rana temporaria]
MASLVRLGGALKAGGRLFGAVARRPNGVRQAGGHAEARYRQLNEVARKPIILSEFLSSFMWFWIMWQFWHNPLEVFGHFPYPDASQWTDEELGIPPEDE